MLVLAATMLTSCSSIHYQIGQTTESFLEKNRKRNFELVRTSNELTVYKWVNGWSYDAPYFFYFQNGTLLQVDRGTRAPDITIQSTTNNY